MGMTRKEPRFHSEAPESNLHCDAPLKRQRLHDAIAWSGGLGGQRHQHVERAVGEAHAEHCQRQPPPRRCECAQEAKAGHLESADVDYPFAERNFIRHICGPHSRDHLGLAFFQPL